eukprot:m.23781 g.23781  ORF g.23781 m.23781 type:complete len:274 (+) comp11429_c0_seq1:112-933(+)
MADSQLRETLKERLKLVKHVILVLSGKGGVGKSTISTQIAIGLVAKGHKVGLLDVDLCGPSIPTMLGLSSETIRENGQGWVPVYKYDQKLAVISIGFLIGSSDPVVWRGPKKTGMIQQFLTTVQWGELDYLVIDTPPGTSDEHLAVLDCLKEVDVDGAVLVTTPQGVALADVRREASFCKKAKLHVLGVVENMSGFACPHCAECTAMFSSGGGEKLAAEIEAPFLGRVPIDPSLGQALSQGQDFMASCKDAPSYSSIMAIVDQLDGVQASLDG